MSIIKKQGIGTWISLGTILLTLVALIIYGVACAAGDGLEVANASQPFYDFTRPEDGAMVGAVVTCGILTLVFLVGAIVLGQLKFEGTVGKVVGIVIDVLRAVVPVLLMLTLLYYVYGSFTGLGWTFFSNEELEIYEEAIAVGQKVIAALVITAIATVASIVAAFFSITKKDAE